MTEVVDELLVRLGLETDAKGFKEANNQFAGIRSAALKLGAIIGGGVGFHDLTVGVAAARDELGKWAKDAGVSIQFADKLRHAMEKFGGTEADSRGLIDVANNLREAAKWGELAERSFTSMGFNPQRIQQENMSVEETIDFISRGLSNISDRDERNRIAESMGINNPFTRNMLADYSGMQAEFKRAEELGVVTEEITKNAAAFNDAMTDAGRVVRSLKDMIANELLPGMSEWVNSAAEWTAQNRAQIQKGLDIAGNPGGALLLEWAKDSSAEDEDGFLDKLWSGLKDANKPGMGMEFGLLRKLFGLPAGPETSGPAPARPSGPLSNDAIFDALIQRESGGQHYGKDGKLLRSSAGALGITQIMPATARNPGYGIAPLANDSKEEYLRFGREYLAAMMKEFDGDTQKALAAYNAGPGAVKNAVASHGANWMSAMPGETQRYVPQIMDRAAKGGGTTNYYSIDARGATDPAAVENAARKVFKSELSNAVQVSRDGIPNNVQ
ncbi:MAG: lytic transglycosylase domain-containing protein [Gammaproteobacteria bacterium]|uniref:Putative transglycosylase n=1 Tax=viral metagenome TaxID=1070528 RepID=A0A6M3MHN3_9ZZZZ|nr:lytic transglycosylase domain-containing protein [Gammaproteobacteria bacterium]